MIQPVCGNHVVVLEMLWPQRCYLLHKLYSNSCCPRFPRHVFRPAVIFTSFTCHPLTTSTFFNCPLWWYYLLPIQHLQEFCAMAASDDLAVAAAAAAAEQSISDAGGLGSTAFPEPSVIDIVLCKHASIGLEPSRFLPPFPSLA
jgi:hypothetical protein